MQEESISISLQKQSGEWIVGYQGLLIRVNEVTDDDSINVVVSETPTTLIKQKHPKRHFRLIFIKMRWK